MEPKFIKTDRIEVVDALRGFAVLAILLLHHVEHFIFSVYPSDSPAWLSVIDKGVFNGMFALFGGKAYAIFSLLFGFTFYIQYEHQRAKGKDFGFRFLWRLLGLAIIATINAAFFPGGDVLMLYAVVGIVLFIVRKWSDKAVLITAIILLLQPVEWFNYIMTIVNPEYQIPNYSVGALYDQVSQATQSGTFREFLLCNIGVGQAASLAWALRVGRAVQTAGLFLLGLLIGRKQLFISNERNLRFWVAVLAVSATSFGLLHSLRNEIMLASDAVQKSAGAAFDMWQKLAFTFVLVSSFVLLFQRAGFRKCVGGLRLYGKMSLTNYVSQSIIGALIYFPFGLYLAPYLGYTLSLLFGVLVFVVQLKFCKWWLSKHKYGPLEALWRRWTWNIF